MSMREEKLRYWCYDYESSSSGRTANDGDDETGADSNASCHEVLKPHPHLYVQESLDGALWITPRKNNERSILRMLLITCMIYWPAYVPDIVELCPEASNAMPYTMELDFPRRFCGEREHEMAGFVWVVEEDEPWARRRLSWGLDRCMFQNPQVEGYEQRIRFQRRRQRRRWWAAQPTTRSRSPRGSTCRRPTHEKTKH